MTHLPYSAQISQVENIVELCGGGQHLDLRFLPQGAREGDQLLHQLYDLMKNIEVNLTEIW